TLTPSSAAGHLPKRRSPPCGPPPMRRHRPRRRRLARFPTIARVQPARSRTRSTPVCDTEILRRTALHPRGLQATVAAGDRSEVPRSDRARNGKRAASYTTREPCPRIAARGRGTRRPVSVDAKRPTGFRPTERSRPIELALLP